MNFANDIKLRGAIDSLMGGAALQRDLDGFVYSTITNHMKSNKGKSWILHLQCLNPGCMCRLGNKNLGCRPAERFLVIVVDGKLNTSHKFVLMPKRANCILGCINHTIAN